MNETKAEISRTQHLAKQLRRGGICRELVPMEAATGWPVPYRHKGGAYAIFPFFGTAGTSKKGEIAIFSPVATITLDWKTGHPVEYVDCRFRSAWTQVDFARPIGTFPHPAVAGLTKEEYGAKSDALYRLYDQLFDGVAAGGELSPLWLRDFSELFGMLLEPSLETFYRTLAPKFCEQFVGSRRG
jgi:hypothetical protein